MSHSLTKSLMSLQDISQALDALYSPTSTSDVKNQANAFLLEFQRSKDAWSVIFPVFESDQSEQSIKLFMAQTLRSKIQYDFGQLPAESIEGLRSSVLALIVASSSNSLIMRQLAIALVYLIMQDFTWVNGVPQLIQQLSLNEKSLLILLEFLRILPEEMIEVEKTPLTTEEFELQTQNLLMNNIDNVLFLLNDLTSKVQDTELKISILNCFKSWIFELPIDQILNKYSSLWQLIIESFQDEESFDTSVDCLITIITQIDVYVDTNHPIIELIMNFLITLESFIDSNWDDSGVIERLTELFSITIESWHTLIVKLPHNFAKLIEIELKLSSYPNDLDIIQYTFKCWSDLKSLLILPPYADSKEFFKPYYLKLVSILVTHLSYPMTSTSTDLSILFNGNKESEDKFKDFRYEIGDTLKDCCSIAGSFDTLNIPFEKLQSIIQSGNGQWQEIESLLFSIRCMAKEVSIYENKILPEIMQYLVKLPKNPKIIYSAILVLGRYTIWTSKHAEFLEMELNYISMGFEVFNEQSFNQREKDDIIMASSHALKYFCIDCSELLINYLPILNDLYSKIESKIDIMSNYDIIEGLSHIINKFILKDETNEEINQILMMFLNPTLTKLNNVLTLDEINESQATEIADQIEILSIYIENFKPRDFQLKENKVANIVMNSILPIIFSMVQKFGKFVKISERSLKFLRKSIQTFKEFLLPKIGSIGELLILGYSQYQMGCYLWVSGSLINEFCDESISSKEIIDSLWEFSKTQIDSFLKTTNTEKFEELSMLNDDFFRMMRDILMYEPLQLLSNDELLLQILQLSLKSLNIFNEDDTLASILNFLIDLFMWGDENPPISFVEDLPLEIKLKIHQIVFNNGYEIINNLLNLEINKFNYDTQIDGLELIVQLIKLSIHNQQNEKICLLWIDQFLNSLPSNSINDNERNKLLKSIEVAIESKNFRKVRSGINDFVSWFKRKNINSVN